MELLLFWIVMAIVTAMVARSRGRSAFGFFLYGVLVWPIALTHALLSTPRGGDHRASEPPAGDAGGRTHAPPFAPHGVIGERPFRLAPDGSVTVLVDGREVLFPDRRTAAGVFGAVRAFGALPILEADFDDEAADETSDQAPVERGVAHPSYVAGLSEPVRHRGSTLSRARYAWDQVREGDALTLRRPAEDGRDPGAVAILHGTFPLGYVPRRHAWIGRALDAGDDVRASVATVARSRGNPSVPFIGVAITLPAAVQRASVST